MANEKRLIDANALKEDYVVLFDKYIGEVRCVLLYQIVNAHTVDAVEVVRCNDCKHFGTDGCAMDKYTFDVVEEGFCSYGERRTDG